ncbi:GTP-binding protein [Ruegeria sp. AU67]|uniref:CobW family GTP-binding protein n=1 Tax=Ruegeria sp. AU67 TaxID=2108530 RepID=UPI000D69EE79|nr:GTP-binding protein [Ruegeria sp. AU67]
MKLPLTVLGGYLGAGKTTLLNRMLTGDHGRRIAVIVNDFGALNVDASLIAEHSGDTIALTNGCICCSAADGTAVAIAQILKRRDEFDHIAIEASGVAEPGKVARNASAFQLPLDGVIILADADQLPDQVKNKYIGRAVAAQLRQADLIVLNKTDLADAARTAKSRTVLAEKAPGTPVIETSYADLPVEVLFGVTRRVENHVMREESESNVDHDEGYVSAVWESAEPITRQELQAVANDFLSSAIRAKGFVALEGEPDTRHLYQQVGRRWTITPAGTWEADTPTTRILSIRLSVQENGLD